VQDALERRLMELASAAKIPYEFTDVTPRGGVSGVRAMAVALKEIADRAGSDTVVIAAGRDVFAGGRAARAASWIQVLSNRKLVLVRGSRESGEAARRRPQRILIPVLHDFHLQPFELAASISASSVVPDIDVVAARVIKLPPIVPIYSTYRPESLVDSERELSSLRKVVSLPLFRSMRPKLLVVRDTARDLVDFASERNVDAILMQGDWAKMRHGFLAEDEREIARRAKATVIVTLPPA
jgi:hypothetical protein